MDSKARLYIERAENEVTLAKAVFDISSGMSKSGLNIPDDMTFYSAAIGHSYYCIFYSAKAILVDKGIYTSPPEEHKKTLDAFKKNLVDTGVLDVDLLKIYQSIVIKADELLSIFSSEKKKRGQFTYQKLPQANKEPAKESIDNAVKFFKNINKVISI
jgi:uncharacterized protein (UPF0332 family)